MIETVLLAISTLLTIRAFYELKHSTGTREKVFCVRYGDGKLEFLQLETN